MVQQCSGEPFRAEHLGPLVEGKIGGYQDGAPLVALAEYLEEEFRSGRGQGDESQFVDDQQAEAGKLPLQRLSSRLSSRASISSWTRAAAAVKPTDIPLWQAASPSPRATWVLPAPLLPTAMAIMKELHRPRGHSAPELKSAPGGSAARQPEAAHQNLKTSGHKRHEQHSPQGDGSRHHGRQRKGLGLNPP